MFKYLLEKSLLELDADGNLTKTDKVMNYIGGTTVGGLIGHAIAKNKKLGAGIGSVLGAGAAHGMAQIYQRSKPWKDLYKKSLAVSPFYFS